MRLNIDCILIDCKNYQTKRMKNEEWRMENGIQITIINDIVDHETGEEVELDCILLREKNVRECAEFVHAQYAGDCLFIISKDDDFAIVSPPFSEFNTFYTVVCDELILWSDLVILESIRNSDPIFNLGYLTTCLLNPSWRTNSTGLTNISELLSGAVLYSHGNTVHQIDLLSSTVALLNPNHEKSFEDEVSDVRKLIMASVRHKTKRYQGAFSVACSGGLDSSIAAVAASELNPDYKFPLIHCYSEEDESGDERFFFKLISERIEGDPHYFETNSLSSAHDLSPQFLSATVRPCKLAGCVGVNYGIQKCARDNGSHMILGGDGGDQLFLRMNTLSMTSEILAENESYLDLLRDISGHATRLRRSYWEVTKELLVRGSQKKLLRRLVGDLQFPPSSIVNYRPSSRTSVVPDIDALCDLSPSRLFQFVGMRNAELNRIALTGFDIVERQIYLFWPIIRKAIQIKRIHHQKDGHDRAIVRAAFKSKLPDAVFLRTQKGAGQGLENRYNYHSLIESMLAGPICRHRILSRESLQIAADLPFNDNLAFTLSHAAAINDWMVIHESL